ncbi:MAG: VOC family protein [Candidatus Promineifilaceae bacterium]|nr:VOC family protein [Candidatus Promineifilaceae bacterium]
MSQPARPGPFQQQVTFLGVRDLTACAAFYGDVLGLALVLDQGTCLIYSTAGAAFLGFCSHLSDSDKAVQNHPGGPIVTLVSDEVDKWHRYLIELGVPIEKPPTHNPTYNIYHLFVRDPDGYLVEIQRFLDPAWPDP